MPSEQAQTTMGRRQKITNLRIYRLTKQDRARQADLPHVRRLVGRFQSQQAPVSHSVSLHGCVSVHAAFTDESRFTSERTSVRGL